VIRSLKHNSSSYRARLQCDGTCAGDNFCVWVEQTSPYALTTNMSGRQFSLLLADDICVGVARNGLAHSAVLFPFTSPPGQCGYCLWLNSSQNFLLILGSVTKTIWVIYNCWWSVCMTLMLNDLNSCEWLLWCEVYGVWISIILLLRFWEVYIVWMGNESGLHFPLLSLPALLQLRLQDSLRK
jgi:hypothetical protein